MFTAQDVFRIDHYLGKETVQNLMALRFANQLFEPVWNANFVDSVQITMAEDVGIGGRAAFYDATGAARDVLQNHLLQLLALTAMEEPVEFTAEAIQTEKLKVLRAITLPARPRATYAVRGQYDQGWQAGERVPAYTAEKDVPDDSKTETYAAVRLGIDTRRWAGVPFYLRTGKRLPRRVTEIAVLFKKAPHLPFSQTDTEELGHNQLVIRVQPDEGVTLKFGSKVPGSMMEVRDVSMDFLYGEAFTESSPEAYERLILDVLLGDSTLFPRNAEVEASWRVIDPLEEFWADHPPEKYRAGEWGPKEADEMLERDGRAWRRPMTHSVGHHRHRRGQGAGRRAAHRRRRDQRAGADPGRRAWRRRTPPRSRRRSASPRREAPDAGAHGAAAQHRRAGAAAGRRGVDRRPVRPGRVGRPADVRPAGPARRVGHPAAARAGRAGRRVVVLRRRPEIIAYDPLGVFADRRITNVIRDADPSASLRQRADDYAPGDTDLTWTVITPWRAALASAFDTVHAPRRSR